LERRSVKPKNLNWRRWSDGTIISLAKLNPESEERFGSPYYVVHRAHLHDVLHQKARELQIPIVLNQKAETLDVENGIVMFVGGMVVTADLIVAADGGHAQNFNL
jgi:salicylate hydroxylase